MRIERLPAPIADEQRQVKIGSYEKLLSKVVNHETGECYIKKDEAGFTIK
jgi:hypothetical protein